MKKCILNRTFLTQMLEYMQSSVFLALPRRCLILTRGHTNEIDSLQDWYRFNLVGSHPCKDETPSWERGEMYQAKFLFYIEKKEKKITIRIVRKISLIKGMDMDIYIFVFHIVGSKLAQVSGVSCGWICIIYIVNTLQNSAFIQGCNIQMNPPT